MQLHIGKYVTEGTAQIFAHRTQTITHRFVTAQADVYLPEVSLRDSSFPCLTCDSILPSYLNQTFSLGQQISYEDHVQLSPRHTPRDYNSECRICIF